MYYKKIKENFSSNSFTEIGFKGFYGSNGKGISYYSIDNGNDHLFNLIKEPYRKYFSIRLMKINANRITPHTDSGIQVSLNLYLQTNNCETIFYSLKENFSLGKIPGQTTGNVFNWNDLNKESSFIAKQNEVWMLDVAQPHGVVSLSSDNQERIAICLQSNDFSFNETLEILN